MSIGNSICAVPSDLDHLKWLEDAGLASFSNKRLLDLGCGTGFLCDHAIEAGAVEAVGVDIICPRFDGQPKWQFRELNLDGSSWHTGLQQKFDLVLAFDIIEHLESPFRFLQSCHSILAPGGVLVATTPKTASWERFYNPKNWSGVRDPQHKTLFSKYSIRFMLEKVGFSEIRIQAPLRSLEFLGPLQPQIGGQILCLAGP